MRTLGTLIFMAALLLAGSTLASTIHVPDDQPTIAAGLAAATSSDTVLVACGEYYEHGLVLPAGVTLRGDHQGVCVWLWGENQGRLISGTNLTPASRVENFGFFFGDAGGTGADGGALSFSEGTIEVRDCWFFGNQCDYKGGALALQDCVGLVERCAFTANEGEHGGGGALSAIGGELTLRDCTFESNRGIDGGAIILASCAPLIERCLFYDNDALFWGGAVMLNGNAAPILRNCTLARNDAYQGGGLWGCSDSAPVLENCIVAFNTDGAGLFAYPDPQHPTVIGVNCCDVYGNVGGGYGGDLADQTGLNGNFATDPRFCDLNGTGGEYPSFGLAADSPCLPEHNGCGVLIGARDEECEIPTAVPVPAAGRVALLPNRPNPFNPSTELRFALAEPGRVTLTVHDLSGRRQRALLEAAPCPAGEQRLVWDGRNDAGVALPSGVYLLRLEAAGQTLSRKVTLLK